MRTEKEMYDLIISIAQSDERIQAVRLSQWFKNKSECAERYFSRL